VNGILLSSNGSREIRMGRNASATGQVLRVEAGSPAAGSNNGSGGVLELSGGMSTGNNSFSQISFMTATAGSSGSTDNLPSTKMVLNGAGNLGIGTSLPSNPLVIERTNAYGEVDVHTFGGATSSALYSALILGRARGTQAAPSASVAGDVLGALVFRGHFGGAGNWQAEASQIRADAAQNFTGSAAGSRLIFSTVTNGTTSSQPRMTIDHNGNVGIGASVPYTQLHVSGNGQNSIMAANATDGSQVAFVTGNVCPSIEFGKTTGGSAVPGLGFISNEVNAGAGTGVGMATGSPVVRMFIDGTSGYLGIGHGILAGDIPLAKLHVKDNAARTSNFASAKIDNLATSGTAALTKTGLDIQATGAWSSGTGRVVGLNVNVSGGPTNIAALFMGGNVGIGTPTPTSTLHVNGSVAAAITTANAAITLDGTHYTLIKTGTGSVTLPAANTCQGRMYVIVNRTGALLNTSSYVSFSGTVSTIPIGSSVMIQSDGANWQLIK
jgi:hypothetical protein